MMAAVLLFTAAYISSAAMSGSSQCNTPWVVENISLPAGSLTVLKQDQAPVSLGSLAPLAPPGTTAVSCHLIVLTKDRPQGPGIYAVDALVAYAVLNHKRVLIERVSTVSPPRLILRWP